MPLLHFSPKGSRVWGRPHVQINGTFIFKFLKKIMLDKRSEMCYKVGEDIHYLKGVSKYGKLEKSQRVHKL